ncbi:acyl-CoA thioesterase [Isoptericola sp. S6320L]|uniref:acyl-CoA thioesterase n=1 Tax=Isoptericola sp. S6320L TaxID=2926411 RepID=UPI001FF351A8|nr:thioesterase family protein [Isoptericola sp. S6320L]MCK0115866.1 acyl-CoA thioesterase [Isoptericola sp. S6320L]
MPRARHPFPLRWNDNDQYGHVNNTVYYQAMDTAVNMWMIREAGLDPAGAVRGYCVASSCKFRAPVSYPDDDLEVAIGVERLGTTSITWDLPILRSGDEKPVAEGRFTHVFVDAATQRPVPVPASIRSAVEQQLLTPAA